LVYKGKLDSELANSQEIADRHVAAPAIAASHQLRCISADKFERLNVVHNLNLDQPSPAKVSDSEKKDLIDAMQMAVYGCVLGGFVQGLEVSWSRAWLRPDYHPSICRTEVGSLFS
jgi:6-phosphogluconate dehydrogenase